MQRFLPWLLVLVLFLVEPGAGWACPFCESEIGEQVSRGIFNDEFWFNTLLTVLPLPLLLGIVALIHFGLPGSRKPLKAEIATAEQVPGRDTLMKESEE